MRILVAVLLVGSALGQSAKKVRVFVGSHESWQQASTIVASSYSGATHTEQIKTLAKECSAVTITDDSARADFFVSWDSKTWQQTSWGGHENEFSVYNAAKDLVGSGNAHHMKNAARDICKLLK